jgi:hypothetical protein
MAECPSGGRLVVYDVDYQVRAEFEFGDIFWGGEGASESEALDRLRAAFVVVAGAARVLGVVPGEG